MSSGVSINKVQVSLPLMIGVLVVIVGGAFTVAMTWAKTDSHIENLYMHVDQAKAVSGGGIAYQHDVNVAKESLDERITTESKKTRKLLRAMKINCAKNIEGFSCKVNLPEED